MPGLRVSCVLALNVFAVLGQVAAVDLGNERQRRDRRVAVGTVSGRRNMQFPELLDMVNATANVTNVTNVTSVMLMKNITTSFSLSSYNDYFRYFVNVCHAVSRGKIAALLGAVNCDEMRTMSSMLNHARTPFVNIAPSACAVSERGCNGYVCHAMAGMTDVGRVFEELVKFHKWTAVHILYDDSACMTRLYTMYCQSLLNNNDCVPY
ncbi:hypothetical protein LSAT2_020184 [Lamellibrachia satsuma]|nr:hypothetical protein LSAT2_020184 [Lamellibrachia satsuma]